MSRQQFEDPCLRCRNHGSRMSFRFHHRGLIKNCPFWACRCTRCLDVKSDLGRLKKGVANTPKDRDFTPTCRFCNCHGLTKYDIGSHFKFCKFRSCPCKACSSLRSQGAKKDALPEARADHACAEKLVAQNIHPVKPCAVVAPSTSRQDQLATATNSSHGCKSVAGTQASSIITENNPCAEKDEDRVNDSKVSEVVSCVEDVDAVVAFSTNSETALQPDSDTAPASEVSKDQEGEENVCDELSNGAAFVQSSKDGVDIGSGLHSVSDSPAEASESSKEQRGKATVSDELSNVEASVQSSKDGVDIGSGLHSDSDSPAEVNSSSASTVSALPSSGINDDLMVTLGVLPDQRMTEANASSMEISDLNAHADTPSSSKDQTANNEKSHVPAIRNVAEISGSSSEMPESDIANNLLSTINNEATNLIEVESTSDASILPAPPVIRQPSNETSMAIRDLVADLAALGRNIKEAMPCKANTFQDTIDDFNSASDRRLGESSNTSLEYQTSLRNSATESTPRKGLGNSKQAVLQTNEMPMANRVEGSVCQNQGEELSRAAVPLLTPEDSDRQTITEMDKPANALKDTTDSNVPGENYGKEDQVLQVANEEDTQQRNTRAVAQLEDLQCHACKKSWSSPDQLRLHGYLRHGIDSKSLPGQVHRCRVQSCNFENCQEMATMDHESINHMGLVSFERLLYLFASITAVSFVKDSEPRQ